MLVASLTATEPTLYTGAFRGLLAGGGVVSHRGHTGLGLTVGGRFSSVLHLADVELRYQSSDLEAGTGHQLVGAVHLHPLFLFLLANNRLGATLGSFSLRLGLGPSWQEAAGFGAAWEWGLGIDTPLTAPDAGHSVWLGAALTRACDLSEPALFEEQEATHVLLRLEYRLNGI